MKIIRKLFYTTLTTFIIIAVYTISSFKDNTLRTNLELEEVINMKTNTVYLLNKDNYLTKVNIYLDSNKQEEQVKYMVEYLKKNNKRIERGYKGYIPEKTTILSIEIKDNILYLDLSKEFLEENTKVTVPGLVRSLLSIKNIDRVDLKVEKEYINNYNKLLDDKIAINEEYNIYNRKNISEVVIYYLTNDNNYIPVTKYLNDDREKIEIIIDELKESNNSNLISYLNNNLKLNDYEEENDMYILNFNDYLNEDKTTKEYLLNEIAYSIFDNYQVSSVMFKINDKNEKIIYKK